MAKLHKASKTTDRYSEKSTFDGSLIGRSESLQKLEMSASCSNVHDRFPMTICNSIVDKFDIFVYITFPLESALLLLLLVLTISLVCCCCKQWKRKKRIYVVDEEKDGGKNIIVVCNYFVMAL